MPDNDDVNLVSLQISTNRLIRYQSANKVSDSQVFVAFVHSQIGT